MPEPYGDELTVEGFARAKDLPLAEAKDALAQSTQIMDFQLLHRRNPTFGAIWVTYDDGYQIHVRSLDPSFEDAIATLEQQLGRSVIRSTGGASYRSLTNAFDTMFHRLPEVAFEIDHVRGVVIVRDKSDMERVGQQAGLSMDQLEERAGPEPSRDLLVSHAGDILYWLPSGSGTYSPRCTVSFMFRGSSGPGGYATAGHCPDGNQYVSGGTYSNNPAPISEGCSPLDYQTYWAQPYTGYPNPGSLWKTYSSPSHGEMLVAGGYYPGQPATAVGKDSGSQWGEVIAGGSFWVDGTNAECPNPGNRTGIRTDHTMEPGDSGGPVLLWYNNKWFLAAAISAGGVGDTVSSWVPYIPRPAGTQICNKNYQCDP